MYLFITDAASGRHTWAYRWRAAADGATPTPGASASPTVTAAVVTETTAARPAPTHLPLSMPNLLRR